MVDLPTDISPEPQKLAIDAMQDGLEEVPLSRVLTVKQVQELGAGRRRGGSEAAAGGKAGAGWPRPLGTVILCYCCPQVMSGYAPCMPHRGGGAGR